MSDAKNKVKIWSALSNVLIATLNKYNHMVALKNLSLMPS